MPNYLMKLIAAANGALVVHVIGSDPIYGVPLLLFVLVDGGVSWRRARVPEFEENRIKAFDPDAGTALRLSWAQFDWMRLRERGGA